MPLDVGQEAVEGGALIIRTVRIGHQVEAHLPAFHHDLFHTQMAGHAAKADDADKLLSLGRYLAETVFQASFESLDVALLLHLVEFAIERDALGIAGNIGRRETQLEVALDIGLADKLGAVALLVGKIGIEVGELLALQFVHGFFQDFLVGFVSQVGDEAALLRSQHIARPTDIEVLHGDMDTASQLGKVLNGLQSSARLLTQRAEWRREQVAERLTIASSHSATELVEVGQTELLGVIDNNGIGVRHVDAAFDDAGRH